MTRSARMHLIKDIGLLLISLVIAGLLLVTPSVEYLLTATIEREVTVSFLAGVFFTSVLTAPSAIVILGELGGSISPWLVAAVGALGAVFGDLILFQLIESHFNKDIEHFVRTRRIQALFSFSRFRSFTWLLPFVGGLVIASPLPDELGVALLGVAKLPPKTFVIVSYLSNFFGILLVALVGNSLAG